MKKSFLLLILGCAGVGLASAQTFVLTGAGSNTVLDGIYISPYTATVNGVVNTPVICDDFFDEVYLGENWSTTAGTVGSTTTGLFGTENSQGYGEVAWLSEQLYSNPSNAGAISYAIWAVFDSSGVAGWLNSYGDTTTYNAVFGSGGYLAQAAAAVPGPGSGSSFSNVLVYTPVANSQSEGGRPQEFLVVTPEAPSMANLAVDFMGFGALLLVFRRYKFAGR
jgi:hypothetical protein